MEENLMFLEIAKRTYDENSIKEISPLALAFLGDGVFELLVRTSILNRNKNPKKLHVEVIKSVRASAQAKKILSVLDELTEEEKAVYKRGRNAKSHTVPKNAVLADYKNATGLEALFGYLYLLNRGDRILELYKKMDEIE